MDKFIGCPYPIVKDARGYFASQSGTSQIKADLLILLLTNPGSRVMMPTYGTPLNDLVFEPNDASLRSRAREMIINSIRTWEPRISIEQVEVLSELDESSLNLSDDKTELESILMIRILFHDPEDIQTIQELELRVPLNSNSNGA